MPDDAVYARLVARLHDIPLHEIQIAPDVVDLLPRMVDILDEPIGDPGAINTLLMCEAARDAGVKVLLSGMGADELFGGYRKHMACLMAARYQRMPDLARHAVHAVVDHIPVAAGGRGLRYARWAKRFLTFSELPEEAAFRRSYTLYDPADLAALVSPDLDASVDDVFAEHLAVYCDNDLADHVNRMCLADSRLFLPGLNLAYTDRASMAASTEVRVPFVDPIVFRAAFSLPGDQKVQARTGKVALKDAARNWLPKQIVERPKASFSAPLRAWIAHDLRELIDDVLYGASSSSPVSSAARRWTPSSTRNGPDARTAPSTSGSCSPSSCGTAGHVRRAYASDCRRTPLTAGGGSGDGADQGAAVRVHLGEGIPAFVDDPQVPAVHHRCLGVVEVVGPVGVAHHPRHRRRRGDDLAHHGGRPRGADREDVPVAVDDRGDPGEVAAHQHVEPLQRGGARSRLPTSRSRWSPRHCWCRRRPRSAS